MSYIERMYERLLSAVCEMESTKANRIVGRWRKWSVENIIEGAWYAQ